MPSAYLYNHGLPFDKTLGENLKEQRDMRIGISKPSLIIIDGPQGEGKTTLAVQCADFLNELSDLPKIDLSIKHHPQIALGGKEFTKNFTQCKKEGLPVIVYDEAGDFSRRGAVSGFNARLIRRFETFRSSNIIVILCLPNFGILDQHIFDLQIVRAVLHLKDRGKNYGNYYAYNGVESGWIRYWIDKLPRPLRYQAYSKCSWSFAGQFKNLPKERAEQLARLSDFGKDREDMNAEIKFLGLWSYRDLATRLSMSVVWTKKAIAELKISDERTIKKVKYFKNEVLDVLMEYRDSKKNKGK